MRIVTYKSETAPERDRWSAVFYQPAIIGANKSKGIEGTAGEVRHNVVFLAADEASVIAKAEQWLADERLKAAAAKAAEEARMTALREYRAQRAAVATPPQPDPAR